MKEDFELLKPIDIGSFLHARMLSIVPGTMCIVYKANFSLLTAECVSYDPSDTKRLKVSFSKLLTPKPDGGFSLYFQYKPEEIPTE